MSFWAGEIEVAVGVNMPMSPVQKNSAAHAGAGGVGPAVVAENAVAVLQAISPILPCGIAWPCSSMIIRST